MAERDSSGVKFPPPLIYMLGLLAGYLFERWLPFAIAITVRPGVHTTNFWFAPAARVAGWALLALGLAIGFVSVGLFRRAGTSPNPFRPVTAIVTSGIYRITRNPMYLGMVVIYVGISLLIRSAWALVLLPPVVLLVDRLVIAKEEKYLAGKFGEPYLAYKRRVRRWI